MRRWRSVGHEDFVIVTKLIGGCVHLNLFDYHYEVDVWDDGQNFPLLFKRRFKNLDAAKRAAEKRLEKRSTK